MGTVPPLIFHLSNMRAGTLFSTALHTLFAGIIIINGLSHSEPEKPMEFIEVFTISAAALSDQAEPVPEPPPETEQPIARPQPEADSDPITPLLSADEGDQHKADRITTLPERPENIEAKKSDHRQDAIASETVDFAPEQEKEVQKETDVEAAATHVVTEPPAQEIALAPKFSTLPKSRPTPPVEKRDLPTSPVPVENPVSSDETAAVTVPAILTDNEKMKLRLTVQKCWNIGPLSSEAQRTTVVVGFSLEKDGRPRLGTIRLVEFSGGSKSAAERAYAAARSAIIRCGAKGFDLPSSKYDQWREIELAFTPDKMRLR